MQYTQEEILDMTGWSRATLLRRRHAGEFPEPIDPNAKPLAWSVDIVDTWMDDEENNPPNAIDRLIMNRYADEFEATLDDCMDAASEQAKEEYHEEIDEQVHEAMENMSEEEREDALEKALEENPEDDEDEIEEIAHGLMREAAREAVMEEYHPKVEARKMRLARRMALAEMRKWLRRGKRDESAPMRLRSTVP